MSEPLEERRSIDAVASDAAEHVRKMVLEQMDAGADGIGPDFGRAVSDAVAWATESLGEPDLALVVSLQAIFSAFGLLASEVYLALATDRVELALATRSITSSSDFVLAKLAREVASGHIEEMRREGRSIRDLG